MTLDKKIITASALTIISLVSASAASAQQLPQLERQIFRFDSQQSTPSYLGVQTENVSNENFGKYNLNEARGVAVTKVLENSPAATAGLRDKDVILRFDGEPVKSTAKLLRLIGEVAPDQRARLTVYRNGGEQEITVTIGKRPVADVSESFRNGAPFGNNEFRQIIPMTPQHFPENFRNFEFPGTPNNYQDLQALRDAQQQQGRKLGVAVTPLTEQLGNYFGAATGKGLLIENVAQSSAAAKAGLKAGDVILEVDGAIVANQTDLIRELNKKNEGEVALTILRDKQRQTVRATPESVKPAAPANNGTKFKI